MSYELVCLYVEEFQAIKNSLLPLSKKYSVELRGSEIHINPEVKNDYPEGFHNLLGIVGRNGVGKTTYLKALSLLIGAKNTPKKMALVFKDTSSNKFVIRGQTESKLRFFYRNKLITTKSDANIDLGLMLTTSNVSTYEDLMSVDENSNRETIERIGFYRSEIAKDVNIFTTFKLNPRARIVLDVTPKRFEDIGHQWKFLSDEMTIKVLSAFYLTVNSILDKTFEDDNHEGYLRALYIKYVGINVFKVGIKQSFDIEMTQYILEELTNKMLLQNTAIEEFFPGLWGIHSFEYFKEQIETALYDADHNRLSDIYNYIDRVSSLFADLEMSLSISRMSSGQESVFKMLSTIYNGIKEAESVRPRKSSVIIVIDEIDKYIHPEWERIILFEIQRLIKDSRLKCEVVFTTHSPIALSDLQSDSVVYIESLNSPPVKRYDFSTFIQNIHLLLRQPFFLDELQGKMGKSHIEDLILKLNEFEENPQRFNREIYEEYHTKVARIGEKIVRVRLEAKLQNIVYKKISKKSKKRALEYLEELEND